MPSSMPFLKTLWRSMSVAMPLLLTVVASTTLVYSTGGPYEANAGARSGISAFYVDAVAGNDNINDGTQPLSDGNGAGPWQTASKALHWDYPPGTHLLFKRGTVYLGGGALDTVGTKLASTEANPFVLGAYGDELLALPKLEYNVQVRGTHVMVRDLEMHRVILNGAFILLFRCEIHSMIQPPTTLSFANNLIVMNHKSSYCSVVECLVYDCDANDLISIHDSSSGGTVGSHHWVVDNTIIGNKMWSNHEASACTGEYAGSKQTYNVLIGNVLGPSNYPAGCPLAQRPCPSYCPVNDSCAQVVGLPCGTCHYIDTKGYSARGMGIGASTGTIGAPPRINVSSSCLPFCGQQFRP